VEEVRSLLANGWLAPSDLGQYEGQTEWKPLSSMPELHVETLRPTVAPPEPEVKAKPLPIEPRPESEPEPEPAPAPIRPRRPLPLKPILSGMVILIVIGALGYYATVMVQKLRANPPKIFTRAPKTAKIPDQPVKPTNTAIAATAAKTNPAAVTKVQDLPDTKPVAPSPAISNRPTVALLESGVVPEPVILKEVVSPQINSSFVAPKALAPPRFIAQADVDPKLTPFGTYDVQMIQAIQQQWLKSLSEQDVAQGRSGKVVLEFNLNFMGKVDGLKVAESSGDEILELLCKKAVNDSEPFKPWPRELRRLVNGDTRQMRFTFHY
jgi:TonB family protein